MAARILYVVAAVLIAGWLALSLRAIRLETDARELMPPPPAQPDAATLSEAQRLLHRAQSHNPDVRPKVVEGTLLGLAGRNREAAAVLEEVLRDEPDNLRAAIALRANLLRFDPAHAAVVERRIRELAPPVGG
jgi:hypothetical protein